MRTDALSTVVAMTAPFERSLVRTPTVLHSPIETAGAAAAFFGALPGAIIGSDTSPSKPGGPAGAASSGASTSMAATSGAASKIAFSTASLSVIAEDGHPLQ